jgi:hypothetical protein
MDDELRREFRGFGRVASADGRHGDAP